MHIETVSNLEKRKEADALVIPFWKSKKGFEAACELGNLKKSLHLSLVSHDFTGKDGETLWVYADLPEEKRFLLVGLGESEKLTQEKLRRAFGAAAKACMHKKAKNVNLILPQSDLLSQDTVAKSVCEGFFSANYSFDALKNDTLSERKYAFIEKVTLISDEPKEALLQANHTLKIMKGVFLARDLTNGNADDVTPKFLAETAKKLSKSYPAIKTTVYDKKWIQKKGMGLYLAVAQGAVFEPYFIIAKYEGNPSSKDHTVLIGKGITFDTGGLHLKSQGGAWGIETQKTDMAGAALVLGVLQAIAALDLPINVTCIIPAAENAIGSHAYKPGDVYKGYSGKTVEILSTDAEGRLTLADALAFTVKEIRPSRIIDFATLTGSVIVGLGHEIFGIVSNSEMLTQEILHAGQRTSEKGWELPFHEDYKELLKSDVADLKNVAGREGGAINAGLFLHEFVGNTPWAHCDIAGVATAKDCKHYLPKGATGIGVRLMVDFFEHLCQKE